MSDIHRSGGPRPFVSAALVMLCGLLPIAAPAERVHSILFAGDLIIAPDRGRSIARLRPGDPFTAEAAQAAAQRLREAAQDRRHPLAEVSWRAEKIAEGDLAVAFHVNAGPRGRLEVVRIDGAEAFTKVELASVLGVRPPTPRERLLGGGALRVDRLEQDRQALIGHYFRHGHLEADVGPPTVEWAPQLKGFYIVWPILHEGPAYAIGNIHFDADDPSSEEELQRLIPLRAHARFHPEAVRDAAQRLQRHLYRQGHAFATVEGDWEPRVETKRADIYFRVRAGVRQTVGSRTLRGNRVTLDRVIARELNTAPGDPFDPVALEAAQARLAVLPMFARVAIEYEGAAEERELDVIVNVEERRSGRVETGVLYGTVEGGAVEIRVTERNLALQPPFRGGGLTGTLGLVVGPNIRRGEARLLNPRWGYSHFSLDASALLEQNEFGSDLFSQRRLGFNALLGHPVGARQAVSTGIEVNIHELYDLDPALTEPDAGRSNDFRLASWVLAWVLDGRDRPFRPTRGFRLRGDLRLGSEWLGGDTEVVQFAAGGAGYLNPFGDHVIGLRAHWRSVDAYGASDAVPIPLRLLLGGAQDLRSFAYRSVGPRDEQGRLLGGGSAWWSQAEYLFPLGSRFDLAAYLEAGDAAADAYAFSGKGPVYGWGLGFLIRAENFPVRFDVAFPLTVYDDDPENAVGRSRISFSAGHRY